MGIRLRLPLLAFVSFSLSAAEVHWVRLKSPNFEMYTTGGDRNGRETLRYFEQVRTFFVNVMGSIPGKNLPVRIIAFNSKKEYEPYRLNNFATAFYHGTPTRDDIVLSQAGAEVFPVAVHEYAHLVARHAGLRLPPWLNEGMAELYSTLKPMGDKIVVGGLIQGRYQALMHEFWVPLTVICAADQASPYYNEKSQAGSLYNEGWALTHMLILSREYRPGFPKFLDLVNTGAPTAEALNKIYGKTIEEVDIDLQRYLRGTHFQGAVFPQTLAKVTDLEIPAEIAPPFDVKLALADLLNRPGNEQDTRRTLEQLAAEDPKRPEPFAALGYLAWSRRENDEAVNNFGKAFERGDTNPAMLWDYVRLLRGRNPPEAIRVLTELLAQQPERMDVRLDLAAVQLTARQPDAALETLKTVKRVTPDEAPRLFTILAHAHMDKALWGDARMNAESLKKFAKTDADKLQAEEILQYLDARESGPVPARIALPPVERTTADVEPPKLERRMPSRLATRKTVVGSFTQLDCAGKSPKIVLETAEGKKILLIDDPNRVIGATIELTCGPQKKIGVVRIDYIPANQTGVDGLVRAIHFEP